MGTKQKDPCWKGFKHLWAEEPVKETRTHLLKQCERCHGKKWLERRN